MMEPSTCRICLEKTATVCIFDDNDGMQYSAKIMHCVNVSVEQGDGLPMYICRICVRDLAACYEFVLKCETADRSLRQLSTDINAELFGAHPQAEIETEIKVERESFEEPQIVFHGKHKEHPVALNESCAIDLFGEHTRTTIATDTKPQADDDIRRFMFDISKEEQQSGEDDYVDPQIDLTRIFPLKKDRRKTYKKEKKRRKTGPIQCVVCGLMVNSHSAMEIHARTHTGEKPFTCPSCDACFPARGHLKRHIETYHSERERKFTCETCGSSFFRKNDIIIHLRRHTGETPYSCPYCPKKFQQIATLIRHKRTHTGDKPYSCPVCSKPFADKSMVTKHMSVHSDEKKFCCHLCSKSVKSKSALTQHLNLHSNEKHNICSFCGSAFAAKGNLKSHILRVHSEKSGQCSVCLKTFSNLEVHMIKHTGEKPFTCEICRRAFGTKRSLANHIVFKHQNIGKYKCSVSDCNKTFPAPSMLEFHLLKQHSNHTPFICPHCSRGFFRVSDLSRHLRVSHMDMNVKISKSPTS